jgi:hypothetical protein
MTDKAMPVIRQDPLVLRGSTHADREAIRFDYGESDIVAHMTDGLLTVQRSDVVLM